MGRNEIRAQGSTLAIDLFGEIGGIWFFGGMTAESFADVLREHPDATVINLAIKSNGGSFTDAIAMRGLLARHQARVEVQVLGMAASAAALLAVAGDTVLMTPGSFMMIHEARACADGTAAELEQAAALLRGVNDSMVAIFADHTGQTRERIADDMSTDFYLSDVAAVEYGMATGISGNAVALAAADIKGLALPDAIRAQLSAGSRDMDLTQIAAALGCAPTEEAVRAAIAAGKDAMIELARVTSELDTTRAKLLTLEATSATAECDAIVAKLQADGYMSGSETAKLVTQYAEVGNVAPLRVLATALGETRPTVPTGGRQSSTNGAPHDGAGAPAPMKDGEVDYIAIMAKLPDEIQAQFKGKNARLVLSQPAAGYLWDMSGHERPTGAV